jgi:hypothetical protein
MSSIKTIVNILFNNLNTIFMYIKIYYKKIYIYKYNILDYKLR